jgi:hypothetical protein
MKFKPDELVYFKKQKKALSTIPILFSLALKKRYTVLR